MDDFQYHYLELLPPFASLPVIKTYHTYSSRASAYDGVYACTAFKTSLMVSICELLGRILSQSWNNEGDLFASHMQSINSCVDVTDLGLSKLSALVYVFRERVSAYKRMD